MYWIVYCVVLDLIVNVNHGVNNKKKLSGEVILCLFISLL